MFHYERLHGDYALVDDRGNTQFFSPSIAIAYDPDAPSVCKHGPPDPVRQWAKDANAKLRGVFEYAVIESDRWEVEELNRFLANGSYFANFIRSLETNLTPPLTGGS